LAKPGTGRSRVVLLHGFGASEIVGCGDAGPGFAAVRSGTIASPKINLEETRFSSIFGVQPGLRDLNTEE
jgi:hypothetical protein